MKKILSLLTAAFILCAVPSINTSTLGAFNETVFGSEQISISAANNGSWMDGSYFVTNVEIKVKNNGSTAATEWSVNANLPSGSEIVNSWNGKVSLSGTSLNILPMDYNNYIAANSEVSVGMIVKSPVELDLASFGSGNGSGSSNVLPSDESNSSSTGNITSKVTKNGAWRNNGKEYTQLMVTLTNSSSENASDWSFSLSVPSGATTEQVWGANVNVSGTQLTATAVDYNKTIYANGNATFGFVVITDNSYSPANYSTGINGSVSAPVATTIAVATTVATTVASTVITTVNTTNTTNTTVATTEGATETTTAKVTESATATTEKATETTTVAVQPAAGGNGVAAHGQLKLNGTQLVGANGESVALRGMSSHGIAWFPEFINAHSILKTKENGANLFRVAMYTEEYNGYTTGDSAKANAKKLAYSAMDTAIANDMYVIIDWHILNDNNPQNHKEEAKQFFDEVSKKYANNPAVLYEICNEPHGVSWSNDIKPYAEEVIPVIRANSPNAIVIVGTNTWSQDVDEASRDKLSFENVMYSFHFYSGTHSFESFKPKLETALNNGAAVFVTEWGTTQASGNGGVYTAEAQKYLNYFKEKNISWANWSLSNKAEDSAALNSGANAETWTESDLSQSGKFVFGNFN
jgi:endoglucanase